MAQTNTYFFEDKPIFGLDIGYGSVRVLQLVPVGLKYRVIGYGETSFDPDAIHDGVLVKPETIAKSVQELFKHRLVGHITTNRVAMSLPISRAFTRSVEIPELMGTDLAEAVRTEAEQYLPGHQDLYIDYTRNSSLSTSSNVFIVGMPKKIVDSYLILSRLLGLETIVMQTSTGASAHLFERDSQSDIPSLLVDLGSNSADITVYDGGPVISGTVACGGEQLTELIAKGLNLTPKEALLVKTKYGLSFTKKQHQILTALDGPLKLLLKEIKRSIRYYEEHATDKQTISQIIVMGGGANMPGFADYLIDNLRLAVRTFDPSSHIDFGRLQPFNTNDNTSYVTAAGLAAIKPQGIFA